MAERYGIGVDLWSATSFKRLREDALSVERWNKFNPNDEAKTPYVTQQLQDGQGPVVAVTDYMRSVPEMVERFVPRRFAVLGTDGYGRSDDRQALRAFFEVDTANVVVAVLAALSEDGLVPRDKVAEAIAHYGLATDAPDPWTI